MYGKAGRKLNPIPEAIPLDPSNHNPGHKVVPKKVSLKLLEDPDKIQQRMCTVEHPFGTDMIGTKALIEGILAG